MDGVLNDAHMNYAMSAVQQADGRVVVAGRNASESCLSGAICRGA